MHSSLLGWKSCECCVRLCCAYVEQQNSPVQVVCQKSFFAVHWLNTRPLECQRDFSSIAPAILLASQFSPSIVDQTVPKLALWVEQEKLSQKKKKKKKEKRNKSRKFSFSSSCSKIWNFDGFIVLYILIEYRSWLSSTSPVVFSLHEFSEIDLCIVFVALWVDEFNQRDGMQQQCIM